MNLKTINGKWYVTHNGAIIVRDSSAEAWKYIFENMGEAGA